MLTPVLRVGTSGRKDIPGAKKLLGSGGPWGQS